MTPAVDSSKLKSFFKNAGIEMTDYSCYNSVQLVHSKTNETIIIWADSSYLSM